MFLMECKVLIHVESIKELKHHRDNKFYKSVKAKRLFIITVGAIVATVGV